MKAIFVTGTDTGVGKTIVTGLLARFLREAGFAVITQKWIQTGSRGISRDVRLHLRLMGKSIQSTKEYLADISPYVFKAACSAHLAAQLENRRIDPAKIIRSFKILAKKFNFVLVEGLGGALVPFSKKNLVIDIARELDLPVLVVAQNKLGAINHTLLTLEALESRKIKILGIVFNHAPGAEKMVLEDNPRIIRVLTGQKIFGALPRTTDRHKLYAKFLPIGKRILRELKK
jgi:dethiobiotin synthetase